MLRIRLYLTRPQLNWGVRPTGSLNRVHGMETFERCVACLLLAAVAGACRDTGHTSHSHAAAAAASGVSRADAGLGARDPRFIPLAPFSGDVQLLLGDPDSAGPFVMRINELAGTIVPPHTHPVDEHITVVQGTWLFGVGERYDTAALHALPTGAYAFAPAGTTMFAASPDAAVVQIFGNGPFRIIWRDGLATLDQPGSTTFHFRRGDTVSGPRGDGVIREGYASGPVIQYELQLSDGRHVMASERDLHQKKLPAR
jgi:quercetin dioxygenase-like cupin family protein